LALVLNIIEAWRNSETPARWFHGLVATASTAEAHLRSQAAAFAVDSAHAHPPAIAANSDAIHIELQGNISNAAPI
jgi:hypothetical protein